MDARKIDPRPFCIWSSLPEPYGMMETTCGWSVEPPTLDGHGKIINTTHGKSYCSHCEKVIVIDKSDRWWKYNATGEGSHA